MKVDLSKKTNQGRTIYKILNPKATKQKKKQEKSLKLQMSPQIIVS